ncbi:MAG TPA: hypothetical protein VFJ16_25825 [Longimicrobium sp.]|nr:hypothetical protein [Longimicrobium sp.]
MRELLFDTVSAIGVLCGVVLALDALPRAVEAIRRRRAARGGAFGVVVNRAGQVVGTYLDPFGHPWRTPRVHGAGSPWLSGHVGHDGRDRAWEGFGATEEEAFHSANRLRRRHLQLLTMLEDDGGYEDGEFLIPQPYVPES